MTRIQSKESIHFILLSWRIYFPMREIVMIASPDHGSPDIIFSRKRSSYPPFWARSTVESVPKGPSIFASGMTICASLRFPVALPGKSIVTRIEVARELINDIFVSTPAMCFTRIALVSSPENMG